MVRAIAKSSQGATLGASVALAVAHKFLQLCRKQSADGAAFLGGYNSDLAQDFGVKFEGDIGFHAWHVSMCSTIMRAVRTVCQVIVLSPLLLDTYGIWLD